ncbi:hypothetical protein [Clavibacter zhangzhiyongii]|uniref:hypothetical protein n=1 Tax=Clavibacter zhangzhiyongii TaxID=2768071 RepID=UPI0039E1F5CF
MRGASILRRGLTPRVQTDLLKASSEIGTWGDIMDAITEIALFAVLSAVWFYVLYSVIVKAVSAGIREARKKADEDDILRSEAN